MHRRADGRECPHLVACFSQIAGYRCLSLMRAFLVVNCQSALVWLALRSCSQAAISSMRICLLGMRRLRHWDVRTPSSDSARIEPAAVFWSVVPFEALDQAP